MPEFIFTMKDLRKTVPPKREILKGIWLSFYYGAKIGVLGHNGAGKSSLLRIMAGQDDQFTGEAFPGKNATVGFLEQEPKLDPAKTVLGNVEEGVAKQKAILDRYNALMENYSDETADEAAKLQDQIDHQNLWDLDTHLEIAMDALRCPPGDADVSKISGGERRRVALCRLLLQKPDLLLLDEPTNHLDAESVAWLERHLKEYPGTVVAITHDRYFLDNVAGWILELDRGAGIPWEGNYSSWLDQKADAPGAGREGQLGAAEDAAARARVGAHGAAREARQEQGAHHRLRRSAPRRHREAHRPARRAVHPVGSAAGRSGRRSQGRAQGLRRQPPHGGTLVQPAARWDRRRHRAERRGQDDAVPHDHRARRSPTEACCASARR